MIKTLTCIECPKGCVLSVDVENGKVKDVKGAKCPKGIGYAIAELENPARILTATVLAEGLGLKLVPVRTDKPIPKKDLLKAMEEIGKIKVTKRLKSGDALVEDFLGLGVKLVATRTVGGSL
jgi:CxxC motif-containing protein